MYESEDVAESFHKECEKARIIAEQLHLAFIYLDSNIMTVLQEDYLDVYSYRLIAMALCLQKLFGTYLLSSGHALEMFQPKRHNAALSDLLNVQMLSTETLKFYSSGAGQRRIDKIMALTEYPLSYKVFHPCFINETTNCGHCKKCRRDTVTLWALQKLSLYHEVYDVDMALKNISVNIAFLLANQESELYSEVLFLLKEKKIEIPSQCYQIAKQFMIAKKNCEKIRKTMK